MRRADVPTIDGAADPRVADRREEVCEHAERDERGADSRGPDALTQFEWYLPDARDLAQKDPEACDCAAECHERHARAYPRQHRAFVRLMLAKRLC